MENNSRDNSKKPENQNKSAFCLKIIESKTTPTSRTSRVTTKASRPSLSNLSDRTYYFNHVLMMGKSLGG